MKKKHEIVLFENGGASLASPETGEAMHSSIGPWEEANALYVQQCGLAERLRRPGGEPVVIYDLGLGIAANALAAAHGQQRQGVGATSLISFENDLGGLETALANPQKFPFLVPYEGLLRELLERRVVTTERFHWELREGDFLAADLSQDSPEVVFFDFYSPKSGSSLWGVEVFRKLRASLEQKRARHPLLLTYSAATPVRVGLLLAGFHVGRGLATSAKSETTVAALHREDLLSPLSEEWIRKLERSDRYAPYGMEEISREEILSQVRALPQFTRGSCPLPREVD